MLIHSFADLQGRLSPVRSWFKVFHDRMREARLSSEFSVTGWFGTFCIQADHLWWWRRECGIIRDPV